MRPSCHCAPALQLPGSTESESVIRLGNSDQDLERAAKLLSRGELVAVPTETVYGLAGDAADPDAVRRIFAAKGRPTDHPLIVHLPGIEAMDEWAAEVPEAARRLARAFWPGPLTLILPKADHVPDEVTGGQRTVGLRVPEHPATLKLLKIFGLAVAAPSANRFGRISPTRAEHVREEFADNLDLVLDGGPCRFGVESTILSLVTEEPVLLRPGGIPAGQLAGVLGCRPETPTAAATGIRVPGLLPSHYAPLTPLEVETHERFWRRANQLQGQGLRVALMTLEKPSAEGCPAHRNQAIEMPNEPETYARKLYHTLRVLDRGDNDRLLVEAPPETEAWAAINNRLLRAAAKQK